MTRGRSRHTAQVHPTQLLPLLAACCAHSAPAEQCGSGAAAAALNTSSTACAAAALCRQREDQEHEAGRQSAHSRQKHTPLSSRRHRK